MPRKPLVPELVEPESVTKNARGYPKRPPGKKQGIPGQLRAINKRRKLESRERSAKAVAMRASRMSHEQIRVALGLKHVETVSKLISRELKERADLCGEDIALQRGIANDGLDSRERRWRAVIQNPESSSDMVVHAEKALAKLHDQRTALNGVAAVVETKLIVEADRDAMLKKLESGTASVQLTQDELLKVLSILGDVATEGEKAPR